MARKKSRRPTKKQTVKKKPPKRKRAKKPRWTRVTGGDRAVPPKLADTDRSLRWGHASHGGPSRAAERTNRNNAADRSEHSLRPIIRRRPGDSCGRPVRRGGVSSRP